VLEAIRGHKSFVYEYDFGDGWDHEVKVEALTWIRHGLKWAVCLEGANACPPEDCGGAGGYENLVEVLADPSEREHEFLLEWVGGAFDASSFDVAATNAALQRVR
ncbi:MAG: plasmid pRiA4b ORF-3 family protein, partial [Nitrososphaerales archaeon]